MVLVGLLPLLALASTSSVSGMPIDSPPASPALSLHGHGQGSATFSPVPTFSPQLNVPSPTLPSAITVPTGGSGSSFGSGSGLGSSPLVPSQNQFSNNDSNDSFPSSYEGYGTANGEYNRDNIRSGAGAGGGVGRGKGMTNAERMRRGLGILPPTRRMTSKPARRSAKPVVDAAQTQQQQQQPDTSSQMSDAPDDNSVPSATGSNDATNTPTSPDAGAGPSSADQNQRTDPAAQPSDDSSDETTPNSDGDIAQPNGGQTLASKRYVMRMKNPDDGSDMGMVTVPDNDNNPLVGYTPNGNGGNPLTTTFPSDPTSTPFQIAPGSNSNNNDNNNNGNEGDDDGSFSGPRKLLAAVPHRTANGNGQGGNGDLTPGNGDFANLGMGWADSSGLLHIGLSALLDATNSNPSSLPIGPSQVADASDPASFVAPQQLLSRPGGGSGLPVDPSTLTSGGPPKGSDGTGLPTDPTHLLHAGLHNLPVSGSGSELPSPVSGSGLGNDDFGSPQSAIWTVHPKSSRLLAHYVNSDGNTVPTYFVTGGECAHTLCLTADVEAFKTAQGDDAHEVHVLAEAVADL
ncbi:hypothetical protein IAU59_002071 [Kwoniella sp. CBS 9459]